MKRKTIPTPLYKKVFDYFKSGIQLSIFLAFIITVLFCIGIIYSIVTNNAGLNLKNNFPLLIQLIITAFIVSVVFCLSLNVISIILKLIKRDFPDPLEPINPEEVLKELIPLLKNTGRQNIEMELSIPSDDINNLEITSSKIGGIPYTPSDMKWPQNDERKKLTFFGQINLSDVPSNHELPSKGLLQIFLLDNGWQKGLDHSSFENNVGTSNIKIVFHENPNKNKHQHIEAIVASKEFPIKNEAKISFQDVTIQYRSLEHYLTPDKSIIKIARGEVDDIDERLYEKGYPTTNTASSILGYSFFEQGDPRGYPKIREKITNDDEWLQLFQFSDTDDEKFNKKIIEWGDAGFGYIFIRKSDLQKQNFDNLFYWWDCT